MNYLFARKHEGTFIIRSEDTDRARSTKEFEAEILEGLAWLGMEHDEFYRQSDRNDIYRNHLEALIESGKAYLSKEESKAEQGKTVEVVRLKNPNSIVTFTDIVRGDITFDTTELGDFVIARNLDDALYHFTVVVDDFLSGVTHVIRGEDHISNTPRQILIQEAIGAPRPQYAHLPLILAPDRSKMSKRHGATSIEEYRKEGFIAPGIVNYLAMLGWNPGTEQEVFTMAELIAAFDLEKIQKSGAVFDREKFLWYNREHLRRMTDLELADLVLDSIPESLRGTDRATMTGVMPLLPIVRERAYTLNDVREAVASGELEFAFHAPVYETSLLKWKKDASVADALPRLERAREQLERLQKWPTADEAKAELWDLAESLGRGELLWPLRIALSGKERSPDPFTLIAILGQEESLRRVHDACAKMKSV